MAENQRQEIPLPACDCGMDDDPSGMHFKDCAQLAVADAKWKAEFRPNAVGDDPQ